MNNTIPINSSLKNPISRIYYIKSHLFDREEVVEILSAEAILRGLSVDFNSLDYNDLIIHDIESIQSESDPFTQHDTIFLKRGFFNSEDDLLSCYLNEIRKHRILSKRDEIKLGKGIEDGQPSAKYLMIVSNLRLVVKMARRYPTGNMDFLDLIQEGNIGLIKAVDRFDYKLGYRFSTYATYWIRQQINRSLADKERLVRLPVHLMEKLSKFYTEYEDFSRKHGRCPSITELAERLRWPEMVIIKMRSYINNVTYIDDYCENYPDVTHVDNQYELGGILYDVYHGNDYKTLGDSIESNQHLLIYQTLYLSKLSEFVSNILEDLNDRQREVIKRRFGIGYDSSMTLEEIGQAFGVTRERIRQIESKALSRLAHSKRKKKLENYLVVT